MCAENDGVLLALQAKDRVDVGSVGRPFESWNEAADAAIEFGGARERAVLNAPDGTLGESGLHGLILQTSITLKRNLEAVRDFVKSVSWNRDESLVFPRLAYRAIRAVRRSARSRHSALVERHGLDQRAHRRAGFQPKVVQRPSRHQRDELPATVQRDGHGRERSIGHDLLDVSRQRTADGDRPDIAPAPG